MQSIPKRGFNGLVENWQSDFLAAISVALVAMPLALGIAIASDVPTMAGILSAVIGGVVTTFFKGESLGNQWSCGSPYCSDSNLRCRIG
jgi:MFS superfamily sulfate permease-like transporter